MSSIKGMIGYSALAAVLAVGTAHGLRPESSDLDIAAASRPDPFKQAFKARKRLDTQDLLERGETLRRDRLLLRGDAVSAVVRRLNARLAASGGEARLLNAQVDLKGNRHIRVQQYHGGYPVVGSDMVVHVSPSGEIYATGGSLADGLRAPGKAKVGLDQARVLSRGRMGLKAGAIEKQAPRLVIFGESLAYEVLLQEPDGAPNLWKGYVDAETGEVLHKENRILHGAPVGGAAHAVTGSRLTGEGGQAASINGWRDDLNIYFLHNTTARWGVYDQDRFDWSQNLTGDWGTTDRAAISLAKNMELTQQYVSTVLGRNSYDGNGAFANTYVHEGTNYVNAYWDGSGLHFGDGDGVTAAPLTVLDVAAHEFGHAITEYTSGLIYSYESGALNESYSDILGAVVEFWAQPDGRGSYPVGIDGQADYLMGEDCWLSADALRDLRNPNRFGQPSYYLGTHWYSGSGDNGGVHYNSGVQNFAYYLLSEGGAGSNDGHPYNIAGLGRTAAGEIALYANLYLLTSTSQYRDAREAWILAATTLGHNAQVVRDVWTACGVLEQVNNLSVSPTSLAFGNVGAGTPVTLNLTLTNSGAIATTISALAFSHPAYASTLVPPISVAGGATLALPVRFTPPATGAFPAQLTLTSNADDNPTLQVSLTGAGTTPARMLISGSPVVATVNAGASATRTLGIANAGQADLHFAVEGAEGGRVLINEVCNNPDFIELWNRGADRGIGGWRLSWVDDAGSAVLNFTFPANQILRAGRRLVLRELTGIANDSTVYAGANIGWVTGSTVAVSLVDGSGAGIDFMRTVNSLQAPPAGTAWTGTGVSFSDQSAYRSQNEDTDSPTGWALSFTPSEYLLNPGQTNTGAFPSWLSVMPASGTVTMGGSRPVLVTLNSSGLFGGVYTANMVVRGNDPVEPNGIQVPVHFTVNGVRRLSATPTALEFGNVRDGSTRALTLTLANTGSEATTVTALASNSSAFLPAVTLPLTVQPFQSVAVSVAFNPSAPGAASGLLTVVSNASDNPSLVIGLSGTGTAAPALVLTPAAFNVALASGDSTTAALVIENTGGDVLTYSLSARGRAALASNHAGLQAWRSQVQTGTALSATGSAPSFSAASPAPRDLGAAIAVYGDGNTTTIASFLTGAGYAARVILNAEILAGDLQNFDVLIMAHNTVTLAPGIQTAIQTFVGNGGGLVTEWSSSTLLFSAVGPNPVSVQAPQWSWYAGAIGNGGYVATSTPVDILNPAHRLATGLADPFSGNGGTEFFYTVSGHNAQELETVAEFTGHGGTWPALMAGRRGRGSVVVHLFDSADDMLDASIQQLWLNSVEFAQEGGLPWLAFAPSEGTVAAGATATVDLRFHSRDLLGGVHEADLLVEHDAPGSPSPRIVPVTLTVDGDRRLMVQPSALAFGNRWVGTAGSMSLRLQNDGNEDTHVSGLSLINDAFTATPAVPLTVPAFGFLDVVVTFAPTALGRQDGLLSIESDAEDFPFLGVVLSGDGTAPPLAQLTPPGFTLNLAPSDAPADRTATLTNAGGDILTWSIASVAQTGSPLPAVPVALASPLPAIPDRARLYAASNYAAERAPGEIIVALKSDRAGFAAAGLLSSLRTLDVKELAMARNPKSGLRSHTGRKLLHLRLEPGSDASLAEAIAALKQDANVAYAEPNYIRKLVAMPNDAAFANLYGMHNNGQSGGTADADIDAPEAWDRHTGTKNLVLGVIDTGIDYLHPDLAANVWVNLAEQAGAVGVDDDGNGYVDDIRGYDFINNDGNPMDDHYHGTHCAGTIAGVGNNGIGVAGVAWTADMAALKIFNSGGSTTDAAILNAVDYSNAMGMKVTSNSWGGGPYSQSLFDIISEGRALGHLFIAAAGNSGRDTDASPNYPSGYALDNIIAVAATDRFDGMASFSNYGRTSVDLAAPGVDTYSCQPGGGYQNLSGTSMATPHVAGAAYLLWSANPFLTSERVREILLETVDPIASLNGRTVTGGRLNIYRALDEAGPTWLSASPMEGGTLAPGVSAPVQVTVNPAGLVAGTWMGRVTVASNDPVNPLRTVDVTAHISGCRALAVLPDTLRFGSRFTGSVTSLNLTLRNDCNDVTRVLSAASNHGAFALAASTPVEVPAFQSRTVPVEFRPTAAGSLEAVLSLATDSDQNPVKTVVLLGEALAPPLADADPDFVSRNVLAGRSLAVDLDIRNTGGSDLVWSLGNVEQGLGAPTAPAAPAVPGAYDAGHFREFAKGEADTREGRPVTQAAGGPDGFGYRWVDSDDPAGPAFVWNDISATGLPVAGGCDDCYTSRPLSFAFPIYGSTFTSVNITSNGYVNFGTGTSQYANYPLPTTSMPRFLVAGFFDDLATSLGIGRVYFQDFGDRAVVQYQDVQRLSGDGTVTFQIVLHSDGRILLYYRTVTGFLLSATTGIQDGTGSVGLNIQYNAAYVKNNLAVSISTLPEWLKASVLSGTIPAGDSRRISLTLDAAGMEAGVYRQVMTLSHNNPQQPSLEIPVTMHVFEAAMSRVLRIGPSAQAAATGTRYFLWNVTAGGEARGMARGSRYTLLLK